MRKLKLLAVLLAFFPLIASAQLNTGQGGTGTTSPSGILYGDGTLHMKSITVGSNLTFSGGILSATGGSAIWPFTVGNKNFNVAVQSTTTPEWFQNGLHASSTSQVVNESIWGLLRLPATTTALLATDDVGNVISTTSVGAGFITGTLGTINTNSPLGGGGTFTRGGTLTLTCSTCFTGVGGLATSSLAAGTGLSLSTTNSAATFNLLSYVATATAETRGQLAAFSSTNGTPATLYSVATSTLSASSPLTGSFVQIGNAGSLGIQAASASQAGSMAAVDYQRLYTATTTFSAPLVYTASTNAVTCTNASNGVTGCMSSLDWGLLHTATTTFSAPLSYSLATNAVTCPTCGTAAWPWFLVSNFATTTNATGTPMWLRNGLFASSTSQFVNANHWGLLTLNATTSANLLATDQAGNIFSTSTVVLTSASSTYLGGGTIYDTGLSQVPLYADANGKVGSAGSGTSGNCVNWGANNTFGDAGSACGSGGGGFPFTVANNFSTTTSATSTLWTRGGLFASSTSQIQTLNIWNYVNFPNTTTPMVLTTGTDGNVIGTSTPMVTAINATSSAATSTFLGKISVGTSTPENTFAAVISNMAQTLGGLAIHTWTNVTNALSIMNAAGTTVFNVDTTATMAQFYVGTSTQFSATTVATFTNGNSASTTINFGEVGGTSAKAQFNIMDAGGNIHCAYIASGATSLTITASGNACN